MKDTDLRVLTVDGGARGHGLHCSIRKSPRVSRAFCTPGNGGIPDPDRRSVKDTDIDGIVRLAQDLQIDLVVVGPEAPLVAGIVNRLRAVGIAAFGPTADAAVLEGSKIFTKAFCRRHKIPTAAFRIIRNFEQAETAIKESGFLVVKADGLCAGKGVTVAKTEAGAIEAARALLVDNIHGPAGSSILIEECLTGRECSIMAFCDGHNAVLLPPARDFKRAEEGDRGPNTGGMGCYAPLPDVDDALLARIKDEIIMPTLRGMAEAGTPYHGLLYAGIMLTKQGPMLIEYNARFGDPETQTVLPLIESDIVEYMLGTLELSGLTKLPPLKLKPLVAVCTVLASNGYPGKYETGFPITGIEETSSMKFFHAGTVRSPALVTSGGRVLSCVGLGENFSIARERSQRGADFATFSNKFYRSDIAANA
ncbi:MAG: PurD [Candidatus Kaiserbacteria bacterium]|nr:PurD [Candidatus Kaiserbacteria bacterium]